MLRDSFMPHPALQTNRLKSKFEGKKEVIFWSALILGCHGCVLMLNNFWANKSNYQNHKIIFRSSWRIIMPIVLLTPQKQVCVTHVRFLTIKELLTVASFWLNFSGTFSLCCSLYSCNIFLKILYWAIHLDRVFFCFFPNWFERGGEKERNINMSETSICCLPYAFR